MRHILFFLTLLLFACKPEPAPAPEYTSASKTEFIYDLGPEGTKHKGNLQTNTTCDQCESIEQDVITGGLNAWKVQTTSEFSDLLIDLDTTFGYPIDFTKARYLTLRMMVPENSYIRAMKLNFKDADGNFGGIGEIVNNFPNHWGEWQTVTINLQEALQDFRQWHGDVNPLSAVKFISLNPYNADQGSPQTYYFNYIGIGNEKPVDAIDDALLPPPSIANQTYTFTFDDPEELNPLMAYRVFEASNQAFAKNIGGNETNAIRLRGQESLNNIAFLPIVSQMNGGQPVDFTKVDEIFFDYYLEPDGDDFDGSTLYLCSEHWNDILIDTTFYDAFTPGKWNTVRVPIRDLDLSVAKGSPDILADIHEWRININFREAEKDITLWMDNIGWR